MTGSVLPATAGPLPWHVAIGSSRGAVHQASGQPNQDSVAQRTGGGAVIVAVADGHGHSRHFRSGTGSALAVAAACQAAARVAAGLGEQSGQAAADAAVRADLAPAIVASWRGAVAAHLAEHPYSRRELAAIDAAGDDEFIPYGSTLIVVAVTARWLACAQIGDGDLLAVCPDGRSFGPLPAAEYFGDQ